MWRYSLCGWGPNITPLSRGCQRAYLLARHYVLSTDETAWQNHPHPATQLLLIGGGATLIGQVKVHKMSKFKD